MLGSWEFSGEPGHVYIRVYEFPLSGAPGRYGRVWALANAGGGTVRVVFFSALFWCVCV